MIERGMPRVPMTYWYVPSFKNSSMNDSHHKQLFGSRNFFFETSKKFKNLSSSKMYEEMMMMFFFTILGGGVEGGEIYGNISNLQIYSHIWDLVKKKTEIGFPVTTTSVAVLRKLVNNF